MEDPGNSWNLGKFRRIHNLGSPEKQGNPENIIGIPRNPRDACRTFSNPGKPEAIRGIQKKQGNAGKSCERGRGGPRSDDGQHKIFRKKNWTGEGAHGAWELRRGGWMALCVVCLVSCRLLGHGNGSARRG